MPEFKKIEEELWNLLEAGRAKIRQEQEDEERREKEQERQAADLLRRRLEPLQKSAKKELPVCWHPFIDWRTEDFQPERHTFLVNLSGFAPIAVTMAAVEWKDADNRVAIEWAPHGQELPVGYVGNSRPERLWLQAGKYFADYDDEQEKYVPNITFREQYRGYDYDPGRVMVLAYEEEQRKAEVQAECDRKNKKDQERQKEREQEAKEQSTLEGRLLQALREYIRQER